MSERYGKYGLPIADENAIEALARAIECQRFDGAEERLRHALAAFLLRAQIHAKEISLSRNKDSSLAAVSGQEGISP